MSGVKTTFHIQRAAKPKHIEHLLMVSSADGMIDTRDIVSQLLDENYEIDDNSVSRSLNLSRKLGLVEKEDRYYYRLTKRGLSCRNLAFFRKDVYHDVIHYLMYSSWERNSHKDHWSWSYIKICESYWHSRPTKPPSKTIFGQIMADALDVFPNLKPAAGTETVDKVVEFINELNPKFFIDSNDDKLTCKEREWFSVEMALLATYYLYIVNGIELSSPILITDSTFERISPLCLTSPHIIILMIETASNTYPFLNIHRGEWGSSVILEKKINISDIA